MREIGPCLTASLRQQLPGIRSRIIAILQTAIEHYRVAIASLPLAAPVRDT